MKCKVRPTCDCPSCSERQRNERAAEAAMNGGIAPWGLAVLGFTEEELMRDEREFKRPKADERK